MNVLGWIATAGLAIAAVVVLFVGPNIVTRAVARMQDAEWLENTPGRVEQAEHDALADDWLHYADEYRQVLGEAWRTHPTTDERGLQ